MLAIKIANILNARGIDKHFTHLVEQGFSAHIAHKLLNPKSQSIRLTDMENLCRVLVCEPNDLIAFYPNEKYPLPQNHPLNNLIKDESNHKELQNTLRHIPYKDLMDLSSRIQNA